MNTTPESEPVSAQEPAFFIVIKPGADGAIDTNIMNVSAHGVTRGALALVMLRAAAEVAAIPDAVVPTRDEVKRNALQAEVLAASPAAFSVVHRITLQTIHLSAATFARVAPRMASLGWELMPLISHEAAADAQAEADAGLVELSAEAAELLKPSEQ